jgi:prepilin-type N-terminal cleavage/methylation domain-containing protein
MSQDQRGYTAVEVMITVTILVTVLFAAISIGDVVQANKVKSAAQQVASALQQARQYAVSNSATYVVALTGTTIAITCSADCPPAAPSEPPTEIINGATTSVPSTPITFGPMGTGDQPGTVQVTYPGVPDWQVRVTGAGGIRACSPTCP